MAKKKYTVLALHISGRWAKYRNVTNVNSLTRHLLVRQFLHANIYDAETKEFIRRVKLTNDD